ncbi:MAG: hypothetical protein IPP59_11390 [Betaproteobacteria bacterium]|nr:hypothetical protein [Candidatus Dechloromonas phosphorivorans]
MKYHQRTVLGGQKQTENPTPTGNFKKLNPFRMHRRLNAIYRSALMNILLVEDNAVNQMLAVNLFQKGSVCETRWFFYTEVKKANGSG